MDEGSKESNWMVIYWQLLFSGLSRGSLCCPSEAKPGAIAENSIRNGLFYVALTITTNGDLLQSKCNRQKAIERT